MFCYCRWVGLIFYLGKLYCNMSLLLLKISWSLKLFMWRIFFLICCRFLEVSIIFSLQISFKMELNMMEVLQTRLPNNSLNSNWCIMFKESSEHLFIHCKVANSLWNMLHNMMDNVFNSLIDIISLYTSLSRHLQLCYRNLLDYINWKEQSNFQQKNSISI